MTTTSSRSAPVAAAALARTKSRAFGTMSTARSGRSPKTLEFHFSVMPRGIFESASEASSATRTGTASSSSTIIAALARAIGTFAFETHATTAAIPAEASTAAAASPARSTHPKRKDPRAQPRAAKLRHTRRSRQRARAAA